MLKKKKGPKRKIEMVYVLSTERKTEKGGGLGKGGKEKTTGRPGGSQLSEMEERRGVDNKGITGP